MPLAVAHQDLVTAGRRSAAWLRWSRYLLASVACFLLSELLFVALFGPHLMGARSAALVASLIAVIPGYLLNRRWTWGVAGRSSLRREVLPYLLIGLVSSVLAALATGAGNQVASAESRPVRTVADATVFMLTYGVIFIVKYLVFNRWLFKSPAAGTDAASAPALSSSSGVR